MILVRLAMGTGASGPDWTATPSWGTAMAASPVVGQGNAGACPETATATGTVRFSDSVGRGRLSWTPRTTARTTSSVRPSQGQRRRRVRSSGPGSTARWAATWGTDTTEDAVDAIVVTTGGVDDAGTGSGATSRIAASVPEAMGPRPVADPLTPASTGSDGAMAVSASVVPVMLVGTSSRADPASVTSAPGPTPRLCRPR